MLRFAVLTSQWAAEGEVFGGGAHEIARPSGKLLRALAGAEAAGVVTVEKASREHRATLGKHVESQAAGEKAYAKAQQDGRWLHGNLSQFVVEHEDKLAAALRATDVTVAEKAATVDRLELELAQARELLGAVEVSS